MLVFFLLVTDDVGERLIVFFSWEKYTVTVYLVVSCIGTFSYHLMIMKNRYLLVALGVAFPGLRTTINEINISLFLTSSK